MLVNSVGEQEKLTCFHRDNTTEAHQSCSLSWKNQLFIFGGNKERRQISRLTGHKLERVGDLTFPLYEGACSVMANQFIFLCFHYHDSKKCRRSAGPLEQFSLVPSFSTYDHRWIPTSCSDSKLYSQNWLLDRARLDSFSLKMGL